MTSYQTDNNPVGALGASIVRTVVPAIMALLITAGLRVGVEIPESIEGVITTVVMALYYALVRLLETRIGPAWGWLLGYARIPSYED